jgi:hypothetical protein
MAMAAVAFPPVAMVLIVGRARWQGEHEPVDQVYGQDAP